MKRALAMALGAMMITGTASTAAAASHVDFTGYYRVNYMMDVNRGFYGGDQKFTDHYFDDRLLIEMTFKPTDEIAVHWQLRGPNRTRWGNNDKNLETQHVYGEIKQEWGNVYVGRFDDGMDVYGLAALGYQPGFGPYVNTGPFDRADVIDAVRFANNWDNGFGLMMQYAKIDTDWVGNGMNRRDSDADWDRIQVEGTYFWDGGGAALGVMIDRAAGDDPYYGSLPEYRDRAYDKGKAVFVNPSIMHTWNEFSVHFEGMAGWGDSRYSYIGGQRPAGRKAAVHHDSDGYGAYLDFDYNYGPGNVNLAGWWVSGSDLGDKDSGSLVDIVGGNFYPLLVAYGATGNGNFRSGRQWSTNAIGIANNAYENFLAPAIGNSNNPTLMNGSGTLDNYFLDNLGQSAMMDRARFTSFNEGTDANHWAVALSGNHSVTDEITLHYAVAYLALNNPNYRVANNVEYSSATAGTTRYVDQEKDLGYEVDFGVQLKLLDNLSFTSSFGFMATGDAYKELRGYRKTVGDPNAAVAAAGDVVKAKWRDADNVYTWYNTLQFDF